MPRQFNGSFSRSLDSKGRLVLPPRFLEALDACGEILPASGSGAESQALCGTFWLTAFYGRLVAYFPKDWENIVSQLSRIRFPSQSLANFKTKLIGLAQELTPDAQGRVRIPQSLMRAANLHKDIVLVGMQDKFEIWDQEQFDALAVEDVSEELAASGVDIAL